jgi:trimeric autotransporter adhesin
VTAALGSSDLARTGAANTFAPDQTFSGNVLLAVTTATAGQIKQGANNLLNTYGTNNVFLGAMAGNLTLTGASNLCIGQGAGNALTSGADDVLIGTSAGTNMTAGYQSVCIGSGAGNSLHASGNNVLIGYHAGFSLNNDNNTMVGVNAGYSVTGTLNTVVGQSAGLNATSAGSCVLVGYSAGGATLRTGGNNVLLGASADTAAAGTAYGVALGDSAVCASNECAFGPHVNVQTGYGTSSVQVRPRADFTDSAVDNTDATRKYRRVWNAWDTAAREVMRGEADGAGPRVGFLGAAAVSRRTVNAACTDLATAVALTNQLRQLLIDLGYAQ